MCPLDSCWGHTAACNEPAENAQRLADRDSQQCMCIRSAAMAHAHLPEEAHRSHTHAHLSDVQRARLGMAGRPAQHALWARTALAAPYKTRTRIARRAPRASRHCGPTPAHAQVSCLLEGLFCAFIACTDCFAVLWVCIWPLQHMNAHTTYTVTYGRRRFANGSKIGSPLFVF